MGRLAFPGYSGSMKTRRVLVIGTNTLFLGSIWLLLKHPGIELIGPLSDTNKLVEDINQMQPEIIIWEGEPEDVEIKAIKVLENVHFKLRIISLNSENNAFNIYQAEPGTINTLQELVQMILKE